jgi:hypothetical protein
MDNREVPFVGLAGSFDFFGESTRYDPPEMRCEAEGCRTKLNRSNRLGEAPHLCCVSRTKWVESGMHICMAKGCQTAIIYLDDDVRPREGPYLCFHCYARYLADPVSVPFESKAQKSKFANLRERSKKNLVVEAVTESIAEAKAANDTTNEVEKI